MSKLIVPRPFLTKKTNCVGHYTTLEALSSILQNDSAVFWASRFGHLSDKKEFVWAQEKVRGILIEMAKKYDEPLEFDERYPYILSLSNALDDKYMWDNYGDCSKGVMLVLDSVMIYNYCNMHSETSREFTSCLDVVYSTEETLHEDISTTLKNLDEVFSNSNIQDAFVELPAYIKDKVMYEKEREFRVVQYAFPYFEISSPNDISEDKEELPQNLKFRIRESEIIPYVEIKLPKEAIVGIILGSKINTEENIQAVDMLIKSRGYNFGIFNTRINEHNE